jgi:hypothetical protein
VGFIYQNGSILAKVRGMMPWRQKSKRKAISEIIKETTDNARLILK